MSARWEPGLAARPLRLWSEKPPRRPRPGRGDGAEGRPVADLPARATFRSAVADRPARAVATALVFSLACVALGAYALRPAGEAPLRRLTGAHASRRRGGRRRRPSRSGSPHDLVELGRAFNASARAGSRD
ncbi:hypothetical protein ACRAWD_29300 [Caulobacter segnis]